MLLTDELLLNFRRCRRRTYLDTHGNSQEKDPQKEFLLKLKRENQAHIAEVIATRSLTYQQPEAPRSDWQLRSQQTLALMQQGADCIHNGSLFASLADWQSCLGTNQTKTHIPSENVGLLAHPTLLIKQPGKSRFGDWLYVPINIKLGRRPKPEYKLIAAFHAQLLGAVQKLIPPQSSLILRQHNEYFINLEYWLPRMQITVADCLQTIATKIEPEVFISRQKCNLCHWHSHCYSMAKAEQHLSLVPGVTPKRYQHLTTLGVNTLESLADISPLHLRETIGTEVATQLRQQAHSLINNQAILKSEYHLLKPVLPTAPVELYFDIEAEPDRNLDYLLGVLLVDHYQNQQKFYPLLAEKPEDEGKIWQQFLALVNLYPNAPIFHYSEYEVDTIKRLAKLYHTPQPTMRYLISRCVDLHDLITQAVILPVESYSLKSLANWIGFHWRDRGTSGDQCVCWYDRWLNTKDRSLIEAILRYNEDDCRATFYLKEWLVKFLIKMQVS